MSTWKIGIAFPPPTLMTTKCSQSGLDRIAALLAPALRCTSVLVLIDQGFVSGTRFLTTLIIGRACGASALGEYSVAFAAIILAGCAQEALVSTPYMVFGNRLRGAARALYAGGSLMQQIVLTVAAVSLTATFAGLFHWVWNQPALSRLLWILCAVLPFCMTREFARRMALAHLRPVAAILLDGSASVIQLLTLVALIRTESLNPMTAFVAIGVASCVSGGAWLLLTRQQFAFRRRSIRRAWKRNWEFGKWLLGGQIVGSLAGNSSVWILAALSGTTVAGIFAGVQNLVLLANPLLLGAGNYLVPRASVALHDGGRSSLAQLVGVSLTLLTSGLVILSFVLIAFGNPILVTLYGTDFGGQSTVIHVLAVCLPLWGVSCVLTAALCALERTRINFLANFAGMVGVVGATGILSIPYGATGAAVGLAVGSLATVIMQLGGLLYVVRRLPPVSVELAGHPGGALT